MHISVANVLAMEREGACWRAYLPSSPMEGAGEARGAAHGGEAVQREHRRAKSAPLLAQPVRRRDAAVLEDDVGRWHADNAHLAVGAGDREAGGVRGNDEGGDGLRAVAAGLGEEADVVGDGAAGDEHLLAVDDVVVAVTAGAGHNIRGLPAPPWFS